MRRNDTAQKEKDVVLACGCVGNLHGAIQRGGKEYVLCDFHSEKPQEAIREVIATDILAGMGQRAKSKQETLF